MRKNLPEKDVANEGTGIDLLKEYKDMKGEAAIFHVNNRTDAKAILESESFRAAGGIAVFRQSIAVVNVGIFIALLGLLAFIPAKETPINWLFKIIFIMGISGMGLCVILNGLVARVYLEPDRLVYRNFCGMKKAIIWRDIQHIKPRTIRNENGIYQYLLVFGKDTRIKISWSFIAYGLLKSEIKKRWKQSTNR